MKVATLAAALAIALAACGNNTINTTNSGTTSSGSGSSTSGASGTTSGAGTGASSTTSGQSSTSGGVPAPVTQSVGALGGTVQTVNGCGVTIPAGALTSTVSITVTPTPSATAPSYASTLGPPCVFTPAAQIFSTPVTITMPYTASQLPNGDTSADIVIQAEPTTAAQPTGLAAFIPLTTTVVDAANISAQTSLFGTFVATVPNANCGAVTGYPGNACGWGVAVGNTFPDISLSGGAALNFGTTPAVDSTTNLASSFSFAQLQALSQPANGGFRYAFIDISAVWCPHCNDEAATLPGSYVPTWLKEGGIIFSILVQSGNPNDLGVYPAATVSDLDAWISKYNINYPMSLDAQQNMVSATGLNAWPANLILRLSDMTVVDSTFGATDAFYAEFAGVLLSCSSDAECWSGATCNTSLGQCQQ